MIDQERWDYLAEKFGVYPGRPIRHSPNPGEHATEKMLVYEFFWKCYQLDEIEKTVLDMMGGGATHEDILAWLKSMEGVKKIYGSTKYEDVMRTLFAKAPFNEDEPQYLAALAEWLHTGKRPDTGQRSEIWKCPEPPQGCGRPMGGEFFPLLVLNDPRCSDCIYRDGHRVKTRLHADGVRKALKEIYDVIHYQTIDVPKVNELLESVVRRWGGADAVGEFWYQQIDLMAQQKPGSKELLGHMRDFSRFWLAVQENQRGHTPLDEMSDEEMADRITGLAVERLGKYGKEHLLKVLVPDENEPVIDRENVEALNPLKITHKKTPRKRPPRKKKA